MEHTKKMILIDPKMLQQQQLQQQNQPPIPEIKGQSLRKLDSEIGAIAEEPKEEENIHNRIIELNQALFKYLNRFKQYQNDRHAPVPIKLPPGTEITKTSDVKKEGENLIAREIIDTLASKSKKKGEVLLERLKANPDISWNERGEISYQGNEIKQSNMFDLFSEALKKQPSKVNVPIGWDTFSLALKDMNTPSRFISNTSLKRYLEADKDKEGGRAHKEMKWTTLRE